MLVGCRTPEAPVRLIRHGLSLLAVLLAAGSLSRADADVQECVPLGDRPSRLTESWVEPHSLDLVARRVREVVGELPYDSVEIDSASGLHIRAVTLEWPGNPQVRPWRGLPFPGANLKVAVERAEEWTRIDVALQLRCAPAFGPPRTLPQDMDVTHFVLHITLGEVTNPISGYFHERTWSEVPGSSCAPLQPSDRKIRICRGIARRHPDDADAQLQYAISLIEFYPQQDAREPIRKLFALTGERPDLYLALGHTFLERELFDSAAQYFRRATLFWPDSAGPQVQLGLALCRAGKPGEALGPLERGMALGTAEPDAFYCAALTARHVREESKAATYFGRALLLYVALMPARCSSAMTWARMGRAASELGRHAEAVAYFTRSRLLDPMLPEREDDLLTAFRRSLAQAPEGPAAPPMPHCP
jgi:tetratricopeptide (TPR) repeat protein